MPTADGFTPEHSLPHFLAERADQPRQQVIGEAADKAGIGPRILRMCIVVTAAAAIGAAILSAGDAVTLFADVKASLIDSPPLQPSADPPAPAIQPTADAQALPPVGGDTPTRVELAATLEPAEKTQTETSEAPSEDLLQKFEAWAARENSPAQAGPGQPVQVAPARAMDNARAAAPPIRKQRKVRPVYNAQAQIRSVQNPRAKMRRQQNARAQVQPVQDARARE
jgi:hypothetical protein